MVFEHVSCRWCSSTDGDLVLDLGRQPACEYFPRRDDPGPDHVFPLRLWLCASCGLAQLADDADLPDEPVGTEPAALAEQRRDAIAAVGSLGLLTPGTTVAEGATPHGGSWIPELRRLGLRPVAAGGPRADLVVDATFGLMHEPDQREALRRLVARMAPNGTLVFAFHTLAAIVAGGQWNAVRLGHYAYYSTPAAVGMLEHAGLTVTDAFRFPLYGGTVALVARRNGTTGASVTALVEAEVAAGVGLPAVLRGLADDLRASVEALRDLVRGSSVAPWGYSAASRAVALLVTAGLTAADMPAIADASPAKQGCRVPGTDIPVVAPAELLAAGRRDVLLFVSDLLPEVRRSLVEVEACGGRWVDCGAGPARPVPAIRTGIGQ